MYELIREGRPHVAIRRGVCTGVKSTAQRRGQSPVPEPGGGGRGCRLSRSHAGRRLLTPARTAPAPAAADRRDPQPTRLAPVPSCSGTSDLLLPVSSKRRRRYHRKPEV